MRLSMTPPRIFAVVSLLLIVSTLLATSFTQSRFFREAVINREAVIVREMVHSVAVRELTSVDLEAYTEPSSQVHFERSLSALTNLSVPPLRERPEDIMPLALHFLDHFNGKFDKDVGPFTPEAFAALEAAEWAGNVRELQHAVERLVAMKAGGPITAADLGPLRAATGPAQAGGSQALSFREARDRFEREYFTGLLRIAGGNISEAARLSGLARQNLYAHIKRLGIVAES